MTTFSEQNKETNFDWNAALSRKNKNISKDSLYTMVAKSANWTTCACGNLCSIIPRNEKGRPIDAKLAILGEEFYVEISTMNNIFKCGVKRKQSFLFTFIKFKAKRILRKIEKRSEEILKEIIKPK